MSINWPEVVAGFLIGLVPLVASRLYLYLHYVRSPGRRRYLGDWHGYWRSTTGRGFVGHEKLNIKYSLLRNRLIVTVATPSMLGQTELEYEGSISERRGMVRYFHLRNRVADFDESWIMIDPFFDPIDVTEGVQVTVDIRGLPVATAQLLSRRELSESELEVRLSKTIITTDPLQSLLATHASAASRDRPASELEVDQASVLESAETDRGRHGRTGGDGPS